MSDTINFTNGTYNLSTHQFSNQINDSDNLTTGYQYQAEFSAEKDNLMNFLAEIMPNEADRNKLLRHTATALTKKDYDSNVYLYGIGANGKSTYMSLVKEAFGTYTAKSSSDILTKPWNNHIEEQLYLLKDKLLINVKMQNIPEVDDVGLPYVVYLKNNGICTGIFYKYNMITPSKLKTLIGKPIKISCDTMRNVTAIFHSFLIETGTEFGNLTWDGIVVIDNESHIYRIGRI